MTTMKQRVEAADITAADITVYEPADGVRVIALDRPAALNALDVPMTLRLIDELEAVAEDPSIRALVITGASVVFSAGADLEVIDVAGEDRAEVEEVMRLVMQLGPLTHALRQPTIAAMSGPVVGGALGLGLACDVRIAAPDATFLAPFVHMGLVPDCGATWLIPRLIGEGQAMEFMLSGRPLGAEHALRLGLVSRLEADPTAAAIALASTLADRPVQAVHTIKRLVREAATNTLAEAVENEAVAQAAAFTGPEFAARFGTWSVTRGKAPA